MIRKYSIILFFFAPLLILAPIEVTYMIDANSLVYTSREWKLIRDDNGKLSSMIIDNNRNLAISKTDYVFDRGDVVKINIATYKSKVKKDDTVAVINSIITNENILALQSELAVAKANLQDKLSGQKPSIIKEYQNRLKIADNNVGFTKEQLHRAEIMVKKDLISQLQYEQYKNAYDLAVINQNLAEKSLVTVSTGEKPEIVQVFQAQVNSLEKQIRTLELKQSKFSIEAPFSGTINYYLDSINLIKIRDISDYIVKVPVKVFEIGYVNVGDTVELEISKTNKLYKAVVSNIDDEVMVRVQDQYFVVTAHILNPDKFLHSGLICRATIYADKIPIYSFVKRKLGF